ncbi:MAG: AMP-binding protein [Chloroflexi bacterium]|nr:AMP-binding protein [Chloroflexota bacterium]
MLDFSDPTAPAYSTPGASPITYATLRETVSALARQFEARGLSRTAVAVAGPRGLPAITSLLAAYDANLCFLPLPVPTPPAWIATLAAHPALSAAIVDGTSGLESWEAAGWAPVLELSVVSGQFPRGWWLLSIERTEARHTSGLAYVLPTSGSTGTPKGVEVSRDAFERKIARLTTLWPAAPRSRWLNWHHYSFDVSLWEVFGCLSTGGTLVGTDDATAADPWALAEVIESTNPKVISMTPSGWRNLPDSFGSGLTDSRLILAGELARVEEIRSWATSRDIKEIWNAYGPTEATIYATAGRIWPATEAWHGASIGRALPGVEVRLRGHGPTAKELVLGGESIAVGYGSWFGPVGDFDQRRFERAADKRWYSTGDLVTFQEDESLQFMGRGDRQVKVQGVRIELGAIETVAQRVDGVGSASAALGMNRRGREGVVLAVIGKGGDPLDEDLMRREVRQALTATLPSHHQPAHIMIMAVAPLTRSGKLDAASIKDAWLRSGWLIKDPHH